VANRLSVNQLCKATFKSGVGAKYLQILKAKFVDCKVYEPHLDHHEVAFREGQRDIIMSIIKELEINVEESQDG
jgi:hypothetical protein